MGCGRYDRKPGVRGFALMEVMIALVVLAIGLYGILDLMAHSRRLSLRAEKRAVALDLARGKMAEIRTAGFSSVEQLLPQPSDRPSTPILYPAYKTKFQAPYPDKGFLWEARFERNDQLPDVLNVEVRVFWHAPAFTPVNRRSFHEYSVSVGGLLVKR